MSTHAEQTYGYAVMQSEHWSEEVAANAAEMDSDEAVVFYDRLIARLRIAREAL